MWFVFALLSAVFAALTSIRAGDGMGHGVRDQHAGRTYGHQQEELAVFDPLGSGDGGVVAVLAFVLAEWVGAALPWLMSAAAGCMVCVTAQEMIPQAVEPDESAGVISIVLGFALMMALDVAL